jgi:hypothetical protein
VPKYPPNPETPLYDDLKVSPAYAEEIKGIRRMTPNSYACHGSLFK